MSASYRRDTLLRVVPMVSSSDRVLNVDFLDLDVVALEQLPLQLVDGVAAVGDVHGHLGRIELDVVVAHFVGQQIVELEHAEHRRWN